MDKETVLDFLFPAICLNCRKKTPDRSPACTDCLSKVEIHSSFFCAKCRARLPYGKKICHKEEPFILGAATDYGEGFIKNLAHYFKFQNVKSCAAPMADISIRYLFPILPANYVIIPMPLGKKRLLSRGYNQSELISTFISQKMNLILLPDTLKRIRETQPQTEMKDVEARNKNVSGCFSVEYPNLVSEKNILLVDDITTSGSTLREAALTLKRAGAKKIIGFAVAKA